MGHTTIFHSKAKIQNEVFLQDQSRQVVLRYSCGQAKLKGGAELGNV